MDHTKLDCTLSTLMRMPPVPVATLDITALFKEFTTTSVVEATPDFLEIPHQLGHDGHGHAEAESSTSATLNCREGSEERNRGKIDKFLIELYPIQLKTLILTLS